MFQSAEWVLNARPQAVGQTFERNQRRAGARIVEPQGHICDRFAVNPARDGGLHKDLNIIRILKQGKLRAVQALRLLSGAGRRSRIR